MSIQTEKWNIIFDQFDGLYTSRDSDDIPDSKSPNLLNVRVSGSNFRGAQGYSLIGTRNTDAGKITAKYTFKKGDGSEVMLRVRDNLTTGILEWCDATNLKWYTLIPGLTTGTKMAFAEFNTSTADQLIFCNGIENMSVWSGKITRLTAALVGGETTINVTDTSDFPTTGSIIYNGIEIAYSGKTATTFTVTSAHASAGSNDGVAIIADDSTHSSITKGNILLSAKNRLWIAGQPEAPNALDYSDEGDAFTFTGGSNRADSGTEDFFGIGGRITGLSIKEEEIIVLGEDGADGFNFTYPTSTTKAPVFREIFRQAGRGCLSSNSVIKLSNEVYFANKNGIASISDLEGSEKVFNKSITRDILPTLKTYDFSEAASVFFDKESILLVACKSDTEFPANDMVIGLEFYKDKKELDTFGITKLDWPVQCFSILNDELYFGSSLEQNSMKGFSTFQNDGAPRTIRYAMKRHNFKDPFQSKGSPYAAVRGFIKDGTDITVKTLYNAGFKGEQVKTIESTGPYVSQATLNTIGAFSLGTNPIGATLEEVSEFKEFTAFLDLGVDYTWRDVQLIFESDTDGGSFIITHVGFTVDEESFATEDNLKI